MAKNIVLTGTKSESEQLIEELNRLIQPLLPASISAEEKAKLTASKKVKELRLHLKTSFPNL